MVDFAVHGLPLQELGVKVVAGSVDPLEQTIELRTSLRIGFPMYGELDAATVSADTGAAFQTGDRTHLHGTAWLVNPDGEINTSVYATGPIGRFTASDIIRKTLFEQKR